MTIQAATPIFEDYRMINRKSTTIDYNGLYCNDDGSTYTSPYACVHKIGNKYRALVHIPSEMQLQLLSFPDIRDAFDHGFIPNYMLSGNSAASNLSLGDFDDELVAAYVAQKVRFDNESNVELHYNLFKEHFLGAKSNTVQTIINEMPKMHFPKINSIEEGNSIDGKYVQQIRNKYKVMLKVKDVKENNNIKSSTSETLLKALKPICKHLNVNENDIIKLLVNDTDKIGNLSLLENTAKKVISGDKSAIISLTGQVKKLVA